MSYNPVEYWTKDREFHLLPTGQETHDTQIHKVHTTQILSILDPLKDEIKSIFEIGCGFGRLTKMLLESLPDIQVYDAIDISLFKIDSAIKYIPSERYSDKLHIWTDDFDRQLFMRKFAQENRGYDLILSSQVLMHQLPSDIQNWIYKINMIAKKYIMNIDWYESPKPSYMASHNFIHEYEKLYNEIIPDPKTIQIRSLMPTTPQNIYFVTKSS